MPSYFLTVRLPLFQLGGDCLEWVDEPEVTYETQAHVFYETEQKVVAETILELFLPNHPDSCFKGVFKIVNGSDVDLPQRVFYRHEIRRLAQIESDGDLAKSPLSHGPLIPLLVQVYKKARELKTDIRRDLGLGEKAGQQQISAEKQAKTDTAISPAAEPAGDSKQAKESPVKEPPKEAAQAYKLYYGTEKSQTEVAKIMTKELRRPVSQGQVSKWVNQYKRWAEANGIPIPENPTIINMDSTKLDMGKRTDGRRTGAPRHRAKIDPDGCAEE